MFKRRNGVHGVGDRAAAVVEAARPIVERAMNDPHLHEALRNAFETGREVTGQLSGRPPREAARTLASDKKLRGKVESSASDLRRAVSDVAAESSAAKKRGRIKTVAALGAAGGALFLAWRAGRGDVGGPRA